MAKFTSFFFNALILTFALPGNTFFGVPIKQLLFMICLFLMIYHMFKYRDSKTVSRPMLLMGLSFIFIFAWFAYGTFFNALRTENAMLMSFASLVGTCLVAYYLISNHVVKIESAKKWVYISAFLKVLFTIVIEYGLIIGSISYNQLMSIYANFGSSPITMSIADLGMIRIMTPSDSFSFVALGFLVADKNVSKLLRAITLTLLVYFSLIVYSRIIFLQLALTLMFTFITKRNIGKLVKITFLFMVSIGSFAFVFPEITNNIYDSLVFRLFSQETVSSDEVRDVQQEVLLSNSNENILVGKGLGYYDKQLIRNSDAKYSYELEYMAFLMQFGIVGFCLIIVLIIYAFYRTIKFNVKNNIVRHLLYFNFVFWAIKPLLNPNFLSSNSASTIVVLIIMSYVFAKENEMGKVKKKFRIAWEKKSIIHNEIQT